MKPLALILAVLLSACGANAPAAETSNPDPAAATASPEPTEDQRVTECEAAGGRWNITFDECRLPTPTARPTPRSTPTPTPAPLSFDEQVAAAETISYEDLFRNAEDHIGKSVYYRGEIIQVLGEPGEWQFRINVTLGQYGFYDDTVYVSYVGTDRFLVDDIVDFVGLSAGPFTYESVMGGEITVPLLFVDASGMSLVE